MWTIHGLFSWEIEVDAQTWHVRSVPSMGAFGVTPLAETMTLRIPHGVEGAAHRDVKLASKWGTLCLSVYDQAPVMRLKTNNAHPVCCGQECVGAGSPQDPYGASIWTKPADLVQVELLERRWDISRHPLGELCHESAPANTPGKWVLCEHLADSAEGVDPWGLPDTDVLRAWSPGNKMEELCGKRRDWEKKGDFPVLVLSVDDNWSVQDLSDGILHLSQATGFVRFAFRGPPSNALEKAFDAAFADSQGELCAVWLVADTTLAQHQRTRWYTLGRTVVYLP